MQFPRSSVIRSRLPSILKSVPARVFAAKANIPLELARELKRDDRLVPPVPLIEGVCFAFGLAPDTVVTFDPAVDLRARAPNWFAGGDGKARIAVCGMGNLGHVLAGLLAARRDVEVAVLVSSQRRAAQIRQGLAEAGAIRVRRPNGEVAGTPALVTHDPAEAVEGAGLVFICVPAHMHLPLLRRVVPHMKSGCHLTCAPAWGGFHWKAREVLAETGGNVHIFGIAGIPWMCSLVRPGAEARVIGAKSINLFVPLQAADTEFAADVSSLLLGMPVVPMASALNVNLIPGNQIVHPAIAYGIFKDRGDRPVAEAPLLYEDMSQGTADLLQSMNDELIAVADGIHAEAPEFVPGAMMSLHLALRVAYSDQIGDASTLRSTFVTNAAYRGIRAPMRTVEGGFVLDERSRFFAEDVPHGMAVVKGIATLAGVATPTFDRVMTWCQERMGKSYLVGDRLTGQDARNTGAPHVFGIDSVSRLVEIGRPTLR